MAKVTGSSPVEPTAKTGLSERCRRDRSGLTPKLTPTSDGAEDPRPVLLDVAHDQLDDPGNVALGVALSEADCLELLVGEGTDQRAKVLGGHLEKAQRVLSLGQAEATAPTPIELMRRLPVEDERLLANEDLFDPAARTHDPVSDVVRDVTDRPTLAAAGEGPLLGSKRLEEFIECPETLEELVRERCTAIARVHELKATSRAFTAPAVIRRP